MKILLALSLAASIWMVPGSVSAKARSRCAPAQTDVAQQIRSSEDSLREFAWAEMAGVFALAQPGYEPAAREDRASSSAALALEEALLEVPVARREALRALARQPSIDRLSDSGQRLRIRAFRGLPTTAISALLEADEPNLRAHAWLWLATTREGGCGLKSVERARFAVALYDLSEVVESGEDLVLRRVGDYALQAYLRRLADDPQATEALLEELSADPGDRSLPPRMRAFAAALRVRRGDLSQLERWLGDSEPELRLAVALAALDLDRSRWEETIIEAAAADGDDLVTQGIVDAILDRSEGSRRTAPPASLATPDDPRLAEATLRWRGEGDPRVALPSATAETVRPGQRRYQGLLAAR